MTGPLDGVRVVELGVWVAGPGAGGLLADWGADVIKVEPPEGDPSRLFARMLGGDLDVNPVFELDNRGKRSIVLDLSSPRAARSCSSWWPTPTSSCQHPRRRARATRPRTRHACERGSTGSSTRIITGYGLDGPDADRAAYDIAAFWARSGMAEALRTPGRPAAVPAGRDG